MQLTSKEQALLTVAVDRIIAKTSPSAAMHETNDMWCELYDTIIGADIDDVGEDYDPLNDYDDSELSWDASAIKSFAENLADDGDDEDGIDDSVNYIVSDLSDGMAWKLYHALNTRFDAEFDAAAKSRDVEPEFNPSDVNPEDRFNRFHPPVEQTEPEQTKKIS